MWRTDRGLKPGKAPVRPGWIERSLADQTIRDSHGIECFFDHLPQAQGLHILDLGMPTESTPWYFSQLGHHVHFASLLHGFDRVQSAMPEDEDGMTSMMAAKFAQAYLDYPPNRFHAVLAWDVLQHLDEAAMFATIAHLAKIVRPNGVMLCLFHSESVSDPVPVYGCGVDSSNSFSMREFGRRRLNKNFSTRTLESLFPQFRAVHFYLKRDALLEVLVFS